MGDVDVNGGNAEVAHSALDLVDVEEVSSKSGEVEVEEDAEHEIEIEDQEFNGDNKTMMGKKIITPIGKRKLRKSKANSTSAIEDDQESNANKGRKRKLSEVDGVNTDDSMDFSGFDKAAVEISPPGLEILQKIIANEEGSQPGKRIKRSKGPRRNIEFKTVDDHSGLLDANEMKSRIDDVADPLESDDDSDDLSKSQDSKAPSPSNSNLSTMVNKRGVNNTRIKAVIEPDNSVYHEPFKFGWKREVIYKNESENAQKKFEIYYYTPKGKRVRNLREVSEFLNPKELAMENFTFVKESVGINDPELEIIRDDASDMNSSNAASLLAKKNTTVNKRGGPTRRSTVKTASPPPPPSKNSAKSSITAKTSNPGSFKVKVTAKKGLQKKEAASPRQDVEVNSPTWNSTPTMTKRNQAEKTSSSYKTKRLLKTKAQEPCSIRCSLSMGLIPNLQCSVCLCLYHPDCVGYKETPSKDVKNYVCKNCQPSSEEGKKTSTSITPPPLIPISMLSSQNIKSGQLSIDKTSPLKKIFNVENVESPSKGSVKTHKLLGNASNNVDNPLSLLESNNQDILPAEDEIVLKPAQNIARLAGKRYIVVPKNNAMAVQSDVTGKAEKNHGLPAQENSNTVNTNNSSHSDVSLPVQVGSDGTQPENVQKIDREHDLELLLGLKSPKTLLTSGNSDLEVSPPLESINTEKISNLEANKTNQLIEMIFGSRNATGLVEEFKNSTDNKHEALNITKNTDKTKNSIDSRRNIVTSKVKKPAAVVETVDQRQYLMATVSAGYNALSRVFQYLKVQELLRAARVCKMWRDLAAHPALWKTVRMKNSQVTDWDGMVATLQRHGTQHLDLRKMLITGESESVWKKFVAVIPKVHSLVKLELCRCPVMVVQDVIKACPQLEVLSAMAIKCDWLNLDSIGNLSKCQELRLKSQTGMLLHGDLTPLEQLTQLTHLSLTSVKELGKKKMDVLSSLVNLECLELGECSDFPPLFGTQVLSKLTKLERLRLEKGQGTCCTFDILAGICNLEKLQQLELVNFDVKSGFDKCLAECRNIKRLLIIPTYISQSATSNNMVLGGVTELSNNLTHFVWGVTLELLRVTELFVDQCNQMNKQVSGDSIPVLKPVPCLKLIENTDDENNPLKADEKQPNLSNPQVDILPLPQLQKLLLTALPKTRVKILKIPFHATWRQNISDTSQ